MTGSLVKTELSEQRKIVANIVNQNRAKLLNISALEKFVNDQVDDPMTKHRSHMAKVAGSTMQNHKESSRKKNASPFSSLKYY